MRRRNKSRIIREKKYTNQGDNRRRSQRRKSIRLTPIEQRQAICNYSNHPILRFFLSLSPEELLVVEVALAILIQLDLNRREKQLLSAILIDIGFSIQQIGFQKFRQERVIEEIETELIIDAVEALQCRLAEIESKLEEVT